MTTEPVDRIRWRSPTSVAAGVALLGLVALLGAATLRMDVANPAIPYVLAVAPSLVLAVPVVTGRATGALLGSVLAVAVAVAAAADVVLLGAVGTLLLVVVGAIAPDDGLRPGRRLLACGAVGGVATTTVALATTAPAPTAVTAALGGVAVAGFATLVARRLGRP